mmetsp:Transcript_13913/g.18568  ORF Transcript_13913/g.18568 Transcript_13913/m.18568 type:complete len:116 (-) Transcript_13913:118-465(-)
MRHFMFLILFLVKESKASQFLRGTKKDNTESFSCYKRSGFDTCMIEKCGSEEDFCVDYTTKDGKSFSGCASTTEVVVSRLNRISEEWNDFSFCESTLCNNACDKPRFSSSSIFRF